MIERIKLLLETQNLTASQFAEKINVQRSSVSHIMSGRNKASLDFVQKILTYFPEVSPDWLINGKGPMLRSSETPSGTGKQEEVRNKNTRELFDFKEQDSGKDKPSADYSSEPKDEDEPVYGNSKRTDIERIRDTNKQVERIVILYTDGTFSTYTSSDKE